MLAELCISEWLCEMEGETKWSLWTSRSQIQQWKELYQKPNGTLRSQIQQWKELHQKSNDPYGLHVAIFSWLLVIWTYDNVHVLLMNLKESTQREHGLECIHHRKINRMVYPGLSQSEPWALRLNNLEVVSGPPHGHRTEIHYELYNRTASQTGLKVTRFMSIAKRC